MPEAAEAPIDTPEAVPSPKTPQKLDLGDLHYEGLMDCVHCGLCLGACPTYRALGVEMDNPRGRIYQIRAVAEGRLPLNETFVEHMYLCLDCRACETACPSGVHFGARMEEARGMIETHYPRSRMGRLLRDFAFKRVFPSRPLLSALVAGMRFYQASGLQWLLRRSGLLNALPGGLGQKEALMPEVPPGPLRRPLPEVTPALGPTRHRVGFLTGCIMSLLFGKINRDTVRVLARNGCEVVAPSEQVCCGALNIHNGERVVSKDLARRNIEVFERSGVAFILSNSAGCGATLREYGDLLRDDPLYAERAKAFSAKVRDVSEFLADAGFTAPAGAVRARVTYDDACHLIHGQKVSKQPRKLIEAIPGAEIVPLRNADQCCGSAGIYNLTNTEMSLRVLEEKMRHVRAANADILVTGNPGCLIQLQAGVRRAGLKMEVLHTMELLERAYQA
ncbi:MAG: 4Fe-4S dicluster domain-containing protein [Candidatus Latescibacteria bacterium]|nr:4Fe-4S dicluster domain-containing protein [Candidatus Latescibacterota bacterium]